MFPLYPKGPATRHDAETPAELFQQTHRAQAWSIITTAYCQLKYHTFCNKAKQTKEDANRAYTPGSETLAQRAAYHHAILHSVNCAQRDPNGSVHSLSQCRVLPHKKP